MNTASNSADHSLFVEDVLVHDRFAKILPKIHHWDSIIVNKLYITMNTTQFGKMARIISFLGDPRLWIAVLPILFVIGLIQMDFTYLVIFTTGFFQSMLTYYLLKFFFRRSRPFNVFPEILRLDKTGYGYGFPSGHCHHSTIMMGLFWLTFFPSPWFLIPLLIYNGLIGLSRLTLGCHFPSDVIVGILSAYLELTFYWLVTKLFYLGIYESLFRMLMA
jgi:membrane-associated phospholipid phosphatase